MQLAQQLNLSWPRKLTAVLQTEASECGLASIAMIANFYDYKTDLGGLRRQYGMSLKGATLKEVIQIADQIGFATRPLRLELDEMAQLRLPCILHWDLNYFVVLASIDAKGAVIHDPAVGIRSLPLTEVSRHFTGVALELSPTEQFKPAMAPPRQSR